MPEGHKCQTHLIEGLAIELYGTQDSFFAQNRGLEKSMDKWLGGWMDDGWIDGKWWINEGISHLIGT